MRRLSAPLFFLLLLPPLLAAQIPTDGLVAYYPFNGNADDESGNGNDGVPQGPILTIDRFGNERSAYSFDGANDLISIGANESLLINADLSLSLWFKTNGLPSEDGIYPLVNRGAWGETEALNHPYHFYLITKNGQTTLGISHEYGPGTNTEVYSVRPVVAGQWTHAVVVRHADEKSYTFYVDGVGEDDIFFLQNPTGGGNTSGNIGWAEASVIFYFDGVIDDVRIYDIPLTSNDVHVLFEEGDPGGPGDGLVAFYPLDGNANDVSGNANNGTVQGGVFPAEDRFGNMSAAMMFNGIDGYIMVPNSTSLQDVGSSFTIASWVNLEEWDNTWAAIAAKSNNTSRGQYGLAFQSGGRIDVDIQGTYLSFFTGLPFDLGEWYFLAATWDGYEARVYANGVFLGSRPANIPSMTNDSPFELGRHTPTNTEYLSGRLDDFRLYNRALTQEEITGLYSSGGWPIPDLVAYYPFNGNASDESGNGNHGVSQGATLTTDRFGNPGKAYEFDGVNDFIAIGSDPSMVRMET